MTDNRNDFEEVTAIEEIDNETCDECDGKFANKVVIGVVTAVAAAATAVVCKKLKVPEKINERRIKKLEKKGFVVFKKEELEETDVDVDEEDTEE